MHGFRVKYTKSSMLLLAALIDLTFSWVYLSHGLFTVIAACMVAFLVSGAASRNVWAQARQRDLGPSQALAWPPTRGLPAMHAQSAMHAQPAMRGRPRPRGGGSRTAEARGRRRPPEVLPQETTVTLADERRATDIDDVFTSLNNQLV